MIKYTLSRLFIAVSLLFSIATVTQAQLSQTFDGLTLNTVSSVTIGGLPTGWSQINADGNTPSPNLSYMGSNAWITRSLSVDGITNDTVAMSISWYNPVATSNDYLITPVFAVPNGVGNFLMWQGMSLDPSFPDGYEVRVSTTGINANDFTTILYSTAAESAAGWVQHSVDISAFAGQNIYVAFRNTSTDKYILLIDDVKITSVTSMDAELLSLNVGRYCQTNSNINITGSIKNNGGVINSLTIEWNDGVPHLATLSGLNIQPYTTYNFTHSVPFNQSTVGEFTINVTITSVNNGATETNTANNTLNTKVSTISNPAHKNVVIEVGNGTWTGWSPRGYASMSDLENDPNYNADFVGIDVHNGDPMQNATYNNAANFSGFPGCSVDRVLKDQSVSTSLFQQYVNDFKVKPTPVQVSANTSFNSTSRLLTINANANFRTVISDDIRFAVILVEDSVHGSTSAYNQTNYYSSTSQNLPLIGAGHNWQLEPNPVPAANMYYNNIGRELIGGYYGQINSISLPTVANSNVNYTFNYTVPVAYNENHLNAVVLVVNGNTGEIINASNIVVSAPTITSNGPTTICAGNTVTLNAPASNIYQWMLNGVNISGANSSTYTTGTSGSYSVVYNSNGNFSTAGPIQVNVLNAPSVNVTASPNNTICEGSSLVLFATGAAQYIWSNNVANGQSFVPVGNGVMNYTVVATDSNGCSTTSNYVVNVIANPSIVSQPSDVLSVVGDVVNFTVAVASNVTSYQWQVNAGTGWNNLSNLGNYSGVNTNTLTISGTQLVQHNTAYRCVLNNTICTIESAPAMLYVSTAVGVNEVLNKSLIIVPNPVKNTCVVSASNGLMNSTIKLIDISGKVVLLDVIKQYNQYELNTSSLSNGIYFVEISDGQQIIKKKLIKE